MRQAWRQRARDLERERTIDLDRGRITGIARGLGARGELIVDTAADRAERVTLEEYYGLL